MTTASVYHHRRCFLHTHVSKSVFYSPDFIATQSMQNICIETCPSQNQHDLQMQLHLIAPFGIIDLKSTNHTTRQTKSGTTAFAKKTSGSHKTCPSSNCNHFVKRHCGAATSSSTVSTSTFTIKDLRRHGNCPATRMGKVSLQTDRLQDKHCAPF